MGRKCSPHRPTTCNSKRKGVLERNGNACYNNFEIMTIAMLAQTIRHLPGKDRMKLFDKLGPSLEDYLLTKIAHDRFKKGPQKRIPWEDLRP